MSLAKKNLKFGLQVQGQGGPLYHVKPWLWYYRRLRTEHNDLLYLPGRGVGIARETVWDKVREVWTVDFILSALGSFWMGLL